MTLLSMGDQVEPGDYAIHSRFNRAVNFTNGRRLVFLVDETIGAGPLNIVLRNLPSREATAGSSFLHVRPHVVAFENHRFRFTENQYYDSRLRFHRWSSDRFHRHVALLGELLCETAPPGSLAFLVDRSRARNFKTGFERAWADQIARGVEQVFHGDLITGIEALRGCGWGLTPSGDDFIAGLLFGLNLFDKMHGWCLRTTMNAIFKAAAGTNPFSNTFLDLARRGLHFQKMKDLILALIQEGEDSVRTSAERLFGLGGSSGTDVATGFLMTVEAEGGTVVQWGEKAKEKGRFGSVPYPLRLSHPELVEKEAAVA
ncbi:MAG: DUF2877 domain-containing protein [Acidobacteriia bacterium]|nr:DUF2877 domain-containing protein [Terriglobia bacterium]